MLQKKRALVLTFDATVQAMAAEKYCLAQGLPGRLIPVPREITAGCGLAWKAAPADETRLTQALTAAGILWSGVYVLDI